VQRVNLNPLQLDKRKTEIMEPFHKNSHKLDHRHENRLPQITEKLFPNPPSEKELREQVIEALKTIYDPEIPVNIYDLGLIYRVDIKGNFADIDMTLTAPACPVANTFPDIVKRSVTLVPGIDGAAVELVWDPPWTQDLINEAARLELGLI